MVLRKIKLQAVQFKTHTFKDLSYDEYCSLLLSAAQQYDAKLAAMALKWSKEGSTTKKFSIMSITMTKIQHMMATMTLMSL